MARIGVLTGGGDCPGLNAVIRAVVRKGDHRARPRVHRLPLRLGRRARATRRSSSTDESTRGILHRGGTILGTLADEPVQGGRRRSSACARRSTARGLDALIPIGGEDTLGVAKRLSDDGVHVVGVPKTIDNDLAGTDFTFGFQTAVQIATDAIDRLHTTAESHNRVIVVEVMGRHAGWIAAYSGMAGGADVILVPERPFDIEEVCEHLRRRHAGGRTFSIVVVAEGATPARRRRVAEHDGRPTRSATPASAASPSQLEQRDRGAHRLRVADDDPRPRPARRHPARLRPRARHPLRRRGGRRGHRRGLREDGRAARDRDRARAARGGAAPSPSCSTRSCSRPPRCSSADGRSPSPPGASTPGRARCGGWRRRSAAVPAIVAGVRRWRSALAERAAPPAADAAVGGRRVLAAPRRRWRSCPRCAGGAAATRCARRRSTCCAAWSRSRARSCRCSACSTSTSSAAALERLLGFSSVVFHTAAGRATGSPRCATPRPRRCATASRR